MTLLLSALSETWLIWAAMLAGAAAAGIVIFLFWLAHLGVIRASEWRERRAAGRFPE